MKFMIGLGIIVFGTVGGCIGNIFDGLSPFNWLAFGGWSIFMSMVGSFFGIWVGYKIGKNYL